MRARLRDSVSGRYRAAENILLTKHVVAAGRFAKDPGSTPGASTTFFPGWGEPQIRCDRLHRGDDVGDVFVKRQAEQLRALLDVFAFDRGGEGLLLHLLAYAARHHARRAIGRSTGVNCL